MPLIFTNLILKIKQWFSMIYIQNNLIIELKNMCNSRPSRWKDNSVSYSSVLIIQMKLLNHSPFRLFLLKKNKIICVLKAVIQIQFTAILRHIKIGSVKSLLLIYLNLRSVYSKHKTQEHRTYQGQLLRATIDI